MFQQTLINHTALHFQSPDDMVLAAQCTAPVARSTDARRYSLANAKRACTIARAHQPGVVMPEGDANALNKWSRKITQPKSQGASQAMLYATGLTEADMNKPQVGAITSEDKSRARSGGERIAQTAFTERAF